MKPSSQGALFVKVGFQHLIASLSIVPKVMSDGLLDVRIPPLLEASFEKMISQFNSCFLLTGITALEMAEGKPPYGDIHPMRAIFMIPTKPPPSFREPDVWSPEFIDFVSRCLVKNPEERATATEMLNHEFIQNAR